MRRGEPEARGGPLAQPDTLGLREGGSAKETSRVECEEPKEQRRC